MNSPQGLDNLIRSGDGISTPQRSGKRGTSNLFADEFLALLFRDSGTDRASSGPTTAGSSAETVALAQRSSDSVRALSQNVAMKAAETKSASEHPGLPARGRDGKNEPITSAARELHHSAPTGAGLEPQSTSAPGVNGWSKGGHSSKSPVAFQAQESPANGEGVSESKSQPGRTQTSLKPSTTEAESPFPDDRKLKADVEEQMAGAVGSILTFSQGLKKTNQDRDRGAAAEVADKADKGRPNGHQPLESLPLTPSGKGSKNGQTRGNLKQEAKPRDHRQEDSTSGFGDRMPVMSPVLPTPSEESNLSSDSNGIRVRRQQSNSEPEGLVLEAEVLESGTNRDAGFVSRENGMTVGVANGIRAGMASEGHVTSKARLGVKVAEPSESKESSAPVHHGLEAKSTVRHSVADSRTQNAVNSPLADAGAEFEGSTPVERGQRTSSSNPLNSSIAGSSPVGSGGPVQMERPNSQSVGHRFSRVTDDAGRIASTTSSNPSQVNDRRLAASPTVSSGSSDPLDFRLTQDAATARRGQQPVPSQWDAASHPAEERRAELERRVVVSGTESSDQRTVATRRDGWSANPVAREGSRPGFQAATTVDRSFTHNDSPARVGVPSGSVAGLESERKFSESTAAGATPSGGSQTVGTVSSEMVGGGFAAALAERSAPSSTSTKVGSRKVEDASPADRPVSPSFGADKGSATGASSKESSLDPAGRSGSEPSRRDAAVRTPLTQSQPNSTAAAMATSSKPETGQPGPKSVGAEEFASQLAGAAQPGGSKPEAVHAEVDKSQVKAAGKPAGEASSTTAPLSFGEPVSAKSTAAETVAGAKASITSETILNQIVEKANIDKLDGASRFSIQLKPEFLGRIEIETVMDADDNLTAVIRVEDPSVKRVLEAGMASLLDKLGEMGLKIQSASVSDFHQGEDLFSGRQRDPGAPQHRPGGSRRGPVEDEFVGSLEEVAEVGGEGQISYFA